jgi:threonine/homoserine/homoserine lactone efflux protein
MLQPLLKGIFCGCLLAVSVGPVFFALLQTSIQKGFRSGMLLAVGISVSDILYAMLCYVGFSQLSENTSFKEGLTIAGGLVMLVVGFADMIKAPVASSNTMELDAKPVGTFRHIFKGIALNAINPSVLFSWVALITVGLVRESYTGYRIFFFILGILLTVFSTDLIKAYIATRLRDHLNVKVLTWMNRVVGCLLIIFGLHLLYLAFYKG